MELFSNNIAYLSNIRKYILLTLGYAYDNIQKLKEAAL